MRTTLSAFTVPVYLLVASLVLAQNSSVKNTSVRSSAAASGSASANATKAANGTASATAAPNGNGTLSSNSTVNRTTSSTPTTYPVATFPSTGALAGTIQAPAPGGNGVAVGPNDSYISGATAQAVAVSLASSLALVAGVWSIIV